MAEWVLNDSERRTGSCNYVGRFITKVISQIFRYISDLTKSKRVLSKTMNRLHNSKSITGSCNYIG